jgi:hypothetical protein
MISDRTCLMKPRCLNKLMVTGENNNPLPPKTQLLLITAQSPKSLGSTECLKPFLYAKPSSPSISKSRRSSSQDFISSIPKLFWMSSQTVTNQLKLLSTWLLCLSVYPILNSLRIKIPPKLLTKPMVCTPNNTNTLSSMMENPKSLSLPLKAKLRTGFVTWKQ